MKHITHFIFLAFVLSACIPPGRLADECSRRYPPRDSTIIRERTDTVLLSYPEVIYEFLDTTQCPPMLTDTLLIVKERTLRIPGRRDTLLMPARDSIIVRTDEAAQALLKEQFVEAEADAIRYKQRLGVMQVVAGALGFLLLVIGVALVVVWKSVVKELNKEDEHDQP